MILLFWPCTHRGLFKVQDGGQRVATARPRWNEPRGGRDRHGGVGGHLFVHTQLLQGGETLTQHRHSGTQPARLLNIKVWEGKRARLYTVWCMCDAVTQTIKGQGVGVTSMENRGSDPTGRFWHTRCLIMCWQHLSQFRRKLTDLFLMGRTLTLCKTWRS